MIVAQETTQWDAPFEVLNHIYFLNNSRTKMYAYIRSDTGESKIFKNPIEFSARGRSFTVLRKVDDESPGVAITGSKGDVYYVTKHNGEYKCTCTGYKYHGTCKHIEQVKNGH